MTRHFTLEQAQALLPSVRLQLETAIAARSALEETQEKESDDENSRQRAERNLAALEEALTNILELGIQVKDLETGLLDFPSLYKGREVLLCWRLGEPGIGHWHELESGFRGRRRVDRDFLDHHRGDPLN